MQDSSRQICVFWFTFSFYIQFLLLLRLAAEDRVQYFNTSDSQQSGDLSVHASSTLPTSQQYTHLMTDLQKGTNFSLNTDDSWNVTADFFSNERYRRQHTVNVIKRDNYDFQNIRFVSLCAEESLHLCYRADLVSLTVLLFWFSLWCHIFQFRVQFPLQMGFLIGVHGCVLPPAPGIQNTFFAYSHPSMRLGFIATTVNLKRVQDIRETQNLTHYNFQVSVTVKYQNTDL